MPRTPSLPLAVTMGDPAGIGGEVLLKTWLRRDEGMPPFFTINNPARLTTLARRIGVSVPVQEIEDPCQVSSVFHQALPVMPQELAVAPVSGQPNVANAPAVIESLERALNLVHAGKAAGLVTLPIAKHILHQAGFAHPGHTEFLALQSGTPQQPSPVPVMMLACKSLKVVPVTIHQSLRDAVNSLTSDAIVHAGLVTADALRRFFGRPNPHLMVAALNPHAGEGGDMGREEIDIIAPAIEELRSHGIEVDGPAPADTLFHPEAREAYDACLCMYHDQALIPIKTIDFHGGVNVTLGLPLIRTSPDHGTAFGIAGTGKADESSLMAAMALAAEMVIRHSRSSRVQK